MQQKPLSKNDIYEAFGYLTHPRVAMRYDVQVPYKKREEFESEYKRLTGKECCAPGQGSGYSVLDEHVDKYGVQYRFSYFPIGLVPSSLEAISKNAPSRRKRISHKPLLLEMFKNGFILGSRPSRSRIISEIGPDHLIYFEFGYTAASIEEKDVGELAKKFNEFKRGFSSVASTPQKPFSLFDKRPIKTVTSRSIGRSAAFRHHVLSAYDNQCCLCSDSLVDLSGVHETEAAHIVSKRLHGSDDVRNGLALCRKHHWAYDRGLFGINSDYSIVVPDKVAAISDNQSLARYHHSSMKVPRSAPAPDISALEWHLEHILSGSL